MIENQINQAIEDYLLTEDTSYALMISGKWGCGKTFYWKNTISPEIIKKTKSVNDTDNAKFYRPIYISLYGIEYVEEISKRIFLEMIPKTGNSKASGILKIIGCKMVSSASSFFNLSDLSLDIDEIKTIYDLKNYVISFDDIERIGGDINLLNKILGFINYLSEHDSIKVLLITNEDELNEKFKKKWKKSKEKIVNQTVPFSVDYDNIIIRLIDTFNKFQDYHKFLTENSSLVIKAFKLSDSNNLRTVKYSLERFLKLFQLFYKNNEHEFIKTYGRNLLYYTMVISFELKKGKIDKEDKFEVSSLSGDLLSQKRLMEIMLNSNSQTNSQQEKIKKSKKEEYQKIFIDTYYNDGEQIINLKTFFDFIISGLYGDNLIASLKDNYLPKDSAIAPHEEILDKLQSFKINGMSQIEFNDGLKKVISYSMNGEYHIKFYPIIYDLLVILDKQKLYQGPPLTKIKAQLLKGISKANKIEANRKEASYVEESWGESPSNDYDVRKKCKKLIEQNLETKNKAIAKDFLVKLCEAPMNAIDIIYNPNNIIEIKPLFKYIPITKLSKVIIRLDNKSLIELNCRINKRFEISSQNTKLQEKHALDKLLKLLSQYIKLRKSCDLKLFHIEFLIRNLAAILKKN